MFFAMENNVMPVKNAVEVEEDLKKEYKKKLRVDDRLIPDPFKIPHGWLKEDKGMAFLPMLLHPDIFNYLMFHPDSLTALIQVIIKTRKLIIAFTKLVGFSHYIFTNYLEVNTAFSK